MCLIKCCLCSVVTVFPVYMSPEIHPPLLAEIELNIVESNKAVTRVREIRQRQVGTGARGQEFSEDAIEAMN